jgi:predicted secreted protein
MNWFAIGLTYAVCWWLVLFMVLPWGAEREATPQPGNAVSAPARPRLRLKLLITSLLTIIPTIAFQWIVSSAKAENVYSTSGAGTGCKPATLPNEAGDMPIDINVPIAPYLDSAKQGSVANANAASSQGSIGLGKGVVKADGSLELNGKRIGAVDTTGTCPPEVADDEEDELDDVSEMPPAKTSKPNDQ